MNSKPSVKVSVKPSVRGYVLSTLRKVESSDKTLAVIDEIVYFRNRKSTVNRPIPTLASNSNCVCSIGLGGKGVHKDTKTDISFPTPQQFSETPGNSPAAR
jgi:hypothetical protein